MTRYAPGYTGPMLPSGPVRPKTMANTGGPKPAPAVQQTTAGTRPPGVRGTTGGPKPAMTGLGSAMQNNPRMANKLGGIGAALGKKMGMKEGGKVSSASKRADGCAVKGKTKGKIV